ncbi:hypothetical protein F5Y09DRAFT_320738 [Xylaria sp. FL1042]|nr:hypothetical protein F5Y09DRAFT_320738 [Xylaria sp. FL1042]
MTWQDGDVTEAKIKSLFGNPLRLRVGNGLEFKVDGLAVQLDSVIPTSANYTVHISIE